MKQSTGLGLIATALLLSGCAALSTPDHPPIRGVVSEGHGEFGYLKSWPKTAKTVFTPDRIQQCVRGLALTPQSSGYQGTSRYQITTLGQTTAFDVSYLLQVTDDAPVIRYHFSHIRQASAQGGEPASSQWLTDNPQPLVDSLAAVSHQFNRCLNQ